MPTLTNKSTRAFGLPKRERQAAFFLEPGETREVSDAYLAALKLEKGLAARFARGEIVVAGDASKRCAAEFLSPALRARLEAIAAVDPRYADRFADLFAPPPTGARMPTPADIAGLEAELAERLDAIDEVLADEARRTKAARQIAEREAAEAEARAAELAEEAAVVVAGKADEVIALVELSSDAEQLGRWGAAETEGKARKTVLEAIAARVAALKTPPGGG